MNAHTFARTSTTLRQALARYRWLIALAVLCLATALTAGRLTSMPPAAPSAVGVAQALDANPAQLGVLSYLRAHQAVAERGTDEPAQLGVMAYLRAHAGAETQPSDPAQSGVMSYLRAHQAVSEASADDPAQQGVLDYLRAHH
jgi:hypothetical protein